MHNYLITKRTKELEQLSEKLGFTKTYFLEDLTIIKADSKKELLKRTRSVKDKIILFEPQTEELLRFALEKTPTQILVGVEKINPKDSVHFVRGALDQITCKIANEKDKTIAFSFTEILNSKNQAKLMARMKLNIKLCKKYKVKTIFSNFSTKKEEIRSNKDLEVFWKVLGGS